MNGKFGQLKTADPTYKMCKSNNCVLFDTNETDLERENLCHFYHQTQNIEYCTLIIHFLFTTGYKFEKHASFKNLPIPTKSIRKKEQK